MKITSLPVVALCSFLCSCASTPRDHAADREVEQDARRLALPPATLHDGETGSPLQVEDIARQASDADIVVFGELHGHPAGLAAVADLLERIVAHRPETTALGLEFYERDAQVHLDDYLAGITDEETFRESVGKPIEKDDHRALIEIARAAGAPVWALNAPRRYVRLARTVGFHAYDAMTDEQRRLVVAPEALSTGRYADEFYTLMGNMGGHGETPEDGPSEMAISFFRSQNVWDATMADSAVRALDAGARPLVIVVGRFHSDFKVGLVERLRERAPGARVLTLSVLNTETPGAEDTGRADVLVAAGEMPAG